jgi:DNA-binding NarL/FixJ family response regulator
MTPNGPATETETTLQQARGAKRRVFLIDDHPVCRHGMSQIINSERDLVVCGEAESTEQALPVLRSTGAEAALVDISTQGANGIAAVKALHGEHPSVPILVVSMQDESVYALRALRAGAQGYITKRQGLNEFLGAVRKVLDGQIYLNPAFGEQLIAQLARGKERTPSEPLERLTDRELEVLQRVGSGQGTKEIAEDLGLSHKTVESHRLHIKEKLGLKNASDMVRFATKWVNEQGGLSSPRAK